MHVILPINIDNTYLNLSSATEANPNWVSGTQYAEGYVVNYDAGSVHRLYQRALPGAGTVTPALDLTNWTDIGPNNRWAMFDTSGSSRTTAATALAVAFTGLEGTYGLGLIGLTGNSVALSVQSSDNAVTYQSNFAISGTLASADQLVVTGLVVPQGGRLNILISNASGEPVACSACAIGEAILIGTTQPRPTLGIVSYSRKVTDEFGTTTLKKRANSKRLSCKVLIQNTDLDRVYRALAVVDGLACVWLVTEQSSLKVLNVFGFFRDFTLDVEYFSESLCALEVEGLA